jgi:hypothetical protein
MKLKENYIGSTIVIVLGVVFFILGLAVTADIPNIAPSLKSGVIMGLPIIFGALAYKSAKKRKFLVETPSIVRIIFEIIYLSLAVLPIVYMMVEFMDWRGFREHTSQNPLTFGLWLGILMAYFRIVGVGKQENDNQ